jgi:hypothetical protein
MRRPPSKSAAENLNYLVFSKLALGLNALPALARAEIHVVLSSASNFMNSPSRI